MKSCGQRRKAGKQHVVGALFTSGGPLGNSFVLVALGACAFGVGELFGVGAFVANGGNTAHDSSPNNERVC